MTRRVLVLGGGRSGKSAFAESLLAAETTVDYVATSPLRADDAEWTERIRVHRERRPVAWRTLETADVAAVLDRSGPAVLVDSITGWLARAMDECGCWTGDERPGALPERAEQLCSMWASTSRSVVAVSDEIGLGVVPDSESGRRFRDELGRLNQRLAELADEVHLIVAGIPLRLR
jgi:adenosylcobinamide kinase/adenosylcobinamide-phosphate guanylyltransferase